ncbi:hypothetical protein CP533_5554, partial [Ophiocordyceps camponoti-saundersi (nom. inval.)]
TGSRPLFSPLQAANSRAPVSLSEEEQAWPAPRFLCPARKRSGAQHTSTHAQLNLPTYPEGYYHLPVYQRLAPAHTHTHTRTHTRTTYYLHAHTHTPLHGHTSVLPPLVSHGCTFALITDPASSRAPFSPADTVADGTTRGGGLSEKKKKTAINKTKRPQQLAFCARALPNRLHEFQLHLDGSAQRLHLRLVVDAVCPCGPAFTENHGLPHVRGWKI